jgi:hypothetical protein
MLRGLRLAIIQTAALLVPAPERAEWLAEWRAELWYVNRRATAFCLGSIRDAFWMNRNSPAPIMRRWLTLESPVKCVMFLAGLAALSSLLAFGEVGTEIRQGGYQDFALFFVCMGLMSLAYVLPVRPLRLGEYPVNRYAPQGPMRLFRWVFLTVKMALVVFIGFMATCALVALVTLLPVQPARSPIPALGLVAVLFGQFFGLRWALRDQRERCPVCLRLLSNPTRIGNASQSFLGWYGTELVCSHGHGFLYMPGTSTSWYKTQRWQYLDPTWKNLLP